MARGQQTTERSIVSKTFSKEKATKSAAPKTKAAAPKTATKSADGKRKHRYRPGTRVRFEIKRQQNMTGTIIPRRPFGRLVRAITNDHTDDRIRFTRSSLETLQFATESFLVDTLTKANRVAIHTKRKTLQAVDIELVRLLTNLPK